MKKTKIVLLLPSRTGTLEGQVDFIGEPIGLATIAAVLENDGFQVKIIDAVAEGNETRVPVDEKRIRIGLSSTQLAEAMSQYQPDIIGLSCMFSAYEADYADALKLCRRAVPLATIVAGGVHATVQAEQLLKSGELDCIVLGEGEETMLEIAREIDSGRDPTMVRGSYWRLSGGIVKNPPRALVADLDALPFPARHLLPMEAYFKYQRRGRARFNYAFNRPISYIATSRGCPCNCVFCAVKTMFGNTWRSRSPENLLREIRTVVESFHVRELALFDDNLTNSRDRILRLCALLKEANLGLSWCTPNGVHIWSLDFEILRAMRDSGYYRLTAGLESGSLKTLRYIRKPYHPAKVREVVAACERLGIWTYSTFIIGFPDETREDIEETINYACELPLDFAAILIAQPYPGTELYNHFFERGLFDHGSLSASSTWDSNYSSCFFSPSELRSMQVEGMRRILSARMRRMATIAFWRSMAGKINSPKKLLYFLRIVSNVLLCNWGDPFLPGIA